MLSQGLVQGLVDGVVVFATDLLMPAMAVFFVLAISLRCLIYYTVKREDWFAKEFSKRVKKFMDARDEKADQSFYVICKRLLEITYYEVFEIRSIMKRRNPDAIMTVTDRVFLVQQGSARIVTDTLKQVKYLKWGERPKFLEISNTVLRNNPCFNKVFGIVPVAVFNDFLNTVPGLFIVGGIFGTFLGIMKALPELGGMNLSDVEGSKLIMDNFLLKISFSMSTSIIGIILSVSMSLANTFFSCEKVYMETVERLENEFDTLWNMSASNKLPAEVSNFEAERDPIEVLSEDLIAKELNVEVGFVTLVRPISKWWGKMGKSNPQQKYDEIPVAAAKAPEKEDKEAA
ncbi:hypothetical protein [Peredibacter starrii]|uniref:MotA/TolQ/ExbB proton channel domain-containing protein n=1 Tax=Peredibacter starrii TaxID=28202 RepID=A0AAX4HR62_9BACT|nr:hypothetical protein [Peredibacter starrii]WPU65717.1 hypothetical protein SOO65_03060 [Peredibacter starrii]